DRFRRWHRSSDDLVMTRSWQWTGSIASLLLLSLGRHHAGAIVVELSEVLAPSVLTVEAEWQRTADVFQRSASFSGTDPISLDCPMSGRCIGPLTRVGRV
ncbi:unnamed protein product, partial [Ectocarpus fasciculatus]